MAKRGIMKTTSLISRGL